LTKYLKDASESQHAALTRKYRERPGFRGRSISEESSRGPSALDPIESLKVTGART
jgi:hypothetical protein